ncbi:sporulation protein YlmC with PRC-barrel domain [Caldalkalibacillus uzonensis]|uniref:Sporulation protein YlmC with PRC-barrel domain n=1 Tax=Caldalkalibacillus uzonensis TaxID=353224 RepID=A0ABU0CYC2_9BACI|nr:response regulator receiver domain [Caldalkalibacillus uzonensis]MDQ0341150.1 sporulation protein YlmC with PRC-barrel domain [Caldalkalibacillus uzonensis]
MNYELVQQVKDIVKGYFDNAVIVDDELFMTKERLEEDLEFDNSELEEWNEVEVQTEYAATTDDYTSLGSRPDETNEKFIRDGFVVMPFRYERDRDIKEQLEKLTPVFNNAKLLIIDWNLENLPSTSPTPRGAAALRIIREFAGTEKGIKCIVVYTQEDNLQVVRDELEADFEFIDDHFFQDRNQGEGNSLFGFVFSKREVEPDKIISEMANILIQNKNTMLHLIDIANRFDENLGKAMRRFNAPFDNVLYTQFVTSGLDSDIPQFLNELLTSEILELPQHESEFNIYFKLKIQNLLRVLQEESFTEEKLNDLLAFYNLEGKDVGEYISDALHSRDFKEGLIKLIKETEIRSVQELKAPLIDLVSPYVKKKKKKTNAVKQLIMILFVLDEFIRDPDSFKEQFYKQAYTLTKLMKFYDDYPDKINTGTILKSMSSENYLLCITPWCDVFRLEKIDHMLKFLRGTVVGKVTDILLENNKSNCEYMVVPINGKLQLIKWEFFDVVTLKADELDKNYRKVTNVKRSYIQKIINRYSSYQIRAGVNELFFKESDYVSNFYKQLF